MTKPGKPRYKNAPKMPKAKASKTTWDNFEKKIKEVTALNLKMTAEYTKALKAYEVELKHRQKIKAMRSSLGKI